MNFHVFIQAHGDLNCIFECGFGKFQWVDPTHPAFILSTSVTKTLKRMACSPNVQTNNLPVTPMWHSIIRNPCLCL